MGEFPRLNWYLKENSRPNSNRFELKIREIIPHHSSSNNSYPNCRLIYGDNLLVIEQLLQEGMEGRVDAIYIDPPFFTGEAFSSVQHFVGDSITPENRHFIEQKAYEDRWNQELESYLSMMFPRLQQMHRLLSSEGALFLHCDQNASHYLKVLCDEIFERSNFRNEIVVSRIQKNIREHQTVPRLNNAYDSILFYAKSNKLRITPPPLQKKKAVWHAFDAPNLRKNLTYPILGIYPPAGRHWMWNEEETKVALNEGRIRKTKTGSIQYLIDSRTTFRDNVWTDLTAYSFNYEYPTEKKEIIIKTLLTMLPMKNGIVADFFCGSGTTLAAACTLGWQWIGCDSSPRAIHISKKRIINLQSNNICSQSFMVQFLNSPEIQPNKSASQCDLEFQIGQVQIIKQQPDHLLIHIPITGISRQTFPINDSSQRDRLQSAWRENNMAIIDLIELDWGKTSEIFQSQIQFSAGFGKSRVLLPSLIECKIPILNNGQLRIRLTDLFGEVAEQMIVLPSLESIADPRKK